jgi:hypothetical protein
MALASPRPCLMAPQTLAACVWRANHSGTSDDNVVVFQRTSAILVKKGDGRHAPMNRGVSTAGAPPQIPAVRAMHGSSSANSGGGARACTCQRSCYTVSGLGTRDNSGPCGASQSVRPDHGMNRRRDHLPPIEQHNGVCARQYGNDRCSEQIYGAVSICEFNSRNISQSG